MMNAMKVAARMSSNPKIHSTPLLCLKKRTYWGSGRNNRRGPPRRHKIMYKVFSNPLVKEFIKCTTQCPLSGTVVHVQEMRTTSLNSKQADSEFSCIDDVDFGLDWNYISVNGKYFKEPSAKKKLYSEWYNIPIEEFKNDNSSSKYEEPEMNLASERLALGLSSSGPLNLEDVKNAYRASALKWHPDRHHGKYKVFAEQKFKACNAAYETLCDELAPH